MGNCEYVRDNYKVPAEIGIAVTVYGKPGVIAADRGHYIGVNFDNDSPGVISNCHPTDGVEYGEKTKIRKMSKSQQRYQKYLDVADCYEDFKHFLQSRAACA